MASNTYFITTNKTVILASGSGSNALSLLDQAKKEDIRVPFLILDRISPLLEKRKEIEEAYNTKVQLIKSTQKGIDLEFEKELLKLIDSNGIEVLFLAGFLKILSENFINSFKEMGHHLIINIHPSLLPKYPGLNSYKKAFENKDELIGHTIHLVTNVVDGGPILFQKSFKRPLDATLTQMIEFGKAQENISYQKVFGGLVKNGIELTNEGKIASFNID